MLRPPGKGTVRDASTQFSCGRQAQPGPKATCGPAQPQVGVGGGVKGRVGEREGGGASATTEGL